ncbi:MAG: hypothetical protein ACM359_06445 [Bacillota bacterium]
MKPSDPAYRRLRYLALPLLLVAAWPLVMGIRILQAPVALRQETFPSTLPTQGPYTAEELKRAESRAARLVPLDKLKEGFPREELETLAENERKMQAIQQGIWERQQGKRIEQAKKQQPVGWTLVGIGGILTILWSWAGWKLWTAR